LQKITSSLTVKQVLLTSF